MNSKDKKVDQDLFFKHLNSKWGNVPCPMCKSNDGWNVSDKVFELREYNEGNIVLGGEGGSILPILPVTCSNCGNTIFVNALLTGAINKPNNI